MSQRRLRRFGRIGLTLTLLVGFAPQFVACTAPFDAGTDVHSRIDQCKHGDIEVDSRAQCLQDDSACYALADGRYCTGPRDTSCPAGSRPLEGDASCPEGQRCFRLSESLECVADSSD